jgi:uroporphyrin-III C-methyltransferase
VGEGGLMSSLEILERCVGKVYLVGAGPGDVELLTLKAVRALREADVILVDDLVNPEILEFAQKCARVVYVGKRGGCKSTPQAFIAKLMLAEVTAGHTVVRLKGGDPFVFGRGGEECSALVARGVKVEIVSGITAGIAAPATLGIPVTHRDAAHGVAFVTGHVTADGGSTNWRALAQSGLTLVIYMGMANLAEIVAQLRAAGVPASKPVAVIEHATLPGQRSVVCALADLEQQVMQHRLASPCVIVIGDVVSYANAAGLAELAQRVA